MWRSSFSISQAKNLSLLNSFVLVKKRPFLVILNYTVEFIFNDDDYYCFKAVYINSIPAEDRSNPIDTTKYPAKLGFTLELCAGIVDKKKSLTEIAAEEILEECGYKIDHQNLEYIIQFQ